MFRSAPFPSKYKWIGFIFDGACVIYETKKVESNQFANTHINVRVVACRIQKIAFSLRTFFFFFLVKDQTWLYDASRAYCAFAFKTICDLFFFQMYLPLYVNICGGTQKGFVCFMCIYAMLLMHMWSRGF